MTENRTSKWVAIATNVAVLVGVVLLVIEIRQNNELAKMQSIQERRYIQQQSAIAFYDRDVSETWMKSIMEPELMTLPEIRVMDAYLAMNILRSSQIRELEDAGLMAQGATRVWMEGDFEFLFSNRFGKVWWYQIGAPGWPQLAEDGNAIIATLDSNSTANDFLAIQKTLQEQE